MKTIQLIFVVLTSIILSACANSLPHRDLHPEEAKNRGYILGDNEGTHRGAVAGYVPRTCSRGGWGLPCHDEPQAAASTEAKAIPAKVAMADSDGDGVADMIDQCKDTARGTAVNAFGCPIGKKVELRLNVQFMSGSSKLNPNSMSDVDQVADVLKTHRDLKIRINGHTDSAGNEARNMALSEARAKAVEKALVARGVFADQLTAKGYGPTQPIADNNTASGRAQNRRVTAELLNP